MGCIYCKCQGCVYSEESLIQVQSYSYLLNVLRKWLLKCSGGLEICTTPVLTLAVWEKTWTGTVNEGDAMARQVRQYWGTVVFFLCTVSDFRSRALQRDDRICVHKNSKRKKSPPEEASCVLLVHRQFKFSSLASLHRFCLLWGFWECVAKCLTNSKLLSLELSWTAFSSSFLAVCCQKCCDISVPLLRSLISPVLYLQSR